MKVLRVRHIRRNVGELERAMAFYVDALGFQPVEQVRRDNARVALLRLGAQALELVEPSTPGLPYPSQRSACDPWFQHLAIVVADMSRAYAHLCTHAFEPISTDGPQTLPPNTGSVSAFKFRDPDGHPLELIHFPPGVGDARWQRQDGLFLGIDHSALVAVNMPRSLAFYEQLGFHVTTRSRNRGAAQEKLDGLANVDVDVVGLTPALDEPPRLELLCYGGNDAATMASNDVAADRMVLDVTEGMPAMLQDPSGHWLALRMPSAGTWMRG